MMITARTTQRMLTTTVTLTTLGRQKLRSQDLSVSQVLPQISAMNPKPFRGEKKDDQLGTARLLNQQVS